MADLEQWISLGQRMLQEDPSAHYRSVLDEVLLDPITVPQPGVVGPEYGGVILIALNPGRGTGDASARLRQQDTLLRRWRADGAPAYDAVFQHWQRDVDEWRVWRSWVQPVLAAAGVKRSQIAYLNLVKVPTVRDKKPSQQLLDLDWGWTAEQLRLLAPKVCSSAARPSPRRS